MNTIFLLIALNVVMVQENGIKKELPAQIMYHDDIPTLRLFFLDSMEVYHIEQVDTVDHAVIMRLSTDRCRGFMRIAAQSNTNGTIYFYNYCGGRDRIDRKFIIDKDGCALLMKQILKKKKYKKRLG